jgi:hypothetical protein
MVPDDTSVYTDQNILDIANEEMDVQLLDKLLALHEEHLTTHIEVPRNLEGVYDIPYRAVGNKLRDIVIVTGKTQSEMTQVSIGELPDYSYGGSSYGIDKFYVESNQIKFIQPNRSYDTVRIYFYIRPNVVTKLESCGVIDEIIDDGTTVKFKFNSLPRTYSDLLTYDFVGARTPNKIKGWDIDPIVESVSYILGEMSFNRSDIESFLSDIKVGDYICKAEESPVPNIPTEMHPLLAQLAAVHILEALGDSEGLANAERRLAKITKSVTTLVDDRVELAPKKIRPRHGTLNEARLGSNKRRGR